MSIGHWLSRHSFRCCIARSMQTEAISSTEDHRWRSPTALHKPLCKAVWVRPWPPPSIQRPSPNNCMQLDRLAIPNSFPGGPLKLICLSQVTVAVKDVTIEDAETGIPKQSMIIDPNNAACQLSFRSCELCTFP